MPDNPPHPQCPEHPRFRYNKKTGEWEFMVNRWPYHHREKTKWVVVEGWVPIRTLTAIELEGCANAARAAYLENASDLTRKHGVLLTADQNHEHEQYRRQADAWAAWGKEQGE